MNLGSGKYLPTVYDFFPRTARGHGSSPRYTKVRNANGDWVKGARRSPLCLNPLCENVSRTGRGDRHHNQDQNRKDWEESVGIRRTSRSTRGASNTQTYAHLAQADPKQRQ